MGNSLETVNFFLGVMVGLSVIQVLVLCIVVVVVYRKLENLTSLIRDYEHRHIAPLATKINEILADVSGVTARVNKESEKADAVLRNALGAVDEATTRVRTNMQTTMGITMAIAETVRAVMTSLSGSGKQDRYSSQSDEQEIQGADEPLKANDSTAEETSPSTDSGQ